MYQIVIQNSRGDKLDITDGRNYETTASGLSPVSANIVTTTVAGMDGARFASSKRQKRNIVLMIYPMRDIEANRLLLYRYICTKKWIRTFIKNGTRDVYIDGYVESFEADLFDKTQVAQVSIICPKPEFIDIQDNMYEINNSDSLFYFPYYTLIANNLVPGGLALDDIRCELISQISSDSLVLGKSQLDKGTLV